MNNSQNSQDVSEVQQPSQPVKSDVSNSTVVVLALLTIVISVISTFIVLNSMTGVNVVQQQSHPSVTSGHVDLTILPPGTEVQNSIPKVSTTGHVALNINR